MITLFGVHPGTPLLQVTTGLTNRWSHLTGRRQSLITLKRPTRTWRERANSLWNSFFLVQICFQTIGLNCTEFRTRHLLKFLLNSKSLDLMSLPWFRHSTPQQRSRSWFKKGSKDCSCCSLYDVNYFTVVSITVTSKEDFATLLGHKLVSVFKHHFWSHIPTLNVFRFLQTNVLQLNWCKKSCYKPANRS